MRLEQIEITGFKSFAKKSILTFQTPVTAVVGPNGSGKSNVVEAFRFVLGEQSMKSMRGRAGSDLIFRGSNNSSKLARASVSITFNNRDRVFSWINKDENEKEAKNLDLFETITFTREIFADGASKYLLNGSEIRLKQMVELLAKVHIGASSYHIISQGEADSILRASTRDRREMLEEALGLKVYHYKIKESEAKLKKTAHTLEDVQSLRRELSPHLKFLASQVQKIEKSRAIREELEKLSLQYLTNERSFIEREKGESQTKKDSLTQIINSLEQKLKELGQRKLTPDSFGDQIRELKEKLEKLQAERRGFENKIGRLEGMIEVERRLLIQKNNTVEDTPSVVFAPSEYERLLSDLGFFVQKIKSAGNWENILNFVGELQSLVDALKSKVPQKQTIVTNDPNNEQNLNQIVQELEDWQQKLAPILIAETEVQTKIKELENKREDDLRQEKIDNLERYEVEKELTENKAELHILQANQVNFAERENNFEEELKEAGFLFGAQFLHQLQATEVNQGLNLAEIKKNIDRLKIRLDEHSGIGNEVVNEYQSTLERDQFLAREIADTQNSVSNLETLIIELKTTLDQDFTTGVTRINQKFAEFFKAMFGGGSAFLSIVIEKKRRKKGEEELELEEEEEDNRFLERGVEVHVSLPEKKVRDLAMLSGGERSLVSIALLFAISQVNPPPFLVLDETDAALDEANSRRYGDMIELLSEYSQLIVVTHNRETMSRAQVLYGVTLGSDGASKLLSIKFDEAVKVAK